MRVIAGAARGRRLVAPEGLDVRPTTDRVKEALFSSLQPMLPGASVLDVFAGSGGLGLEALSRGAVRVTFVERAAPAIAALRRNVDTVGLSGTTIVTAEAGRALREPLPGSPFDLVLADPPYRLPQAELAGVLHGLVGQLVPGAVVVVERAARDGAPPWPPRLRAEGARRYGDTALHRAVLDPGAAGPDGESDEETE